MEAVRMFLLWSLLIISASSLSTNISLSEAPETTTDAEVKFTSLADIEELPIEDVDADYPDFKPEGRLTSATTSTAAVLNQFPYVVHISSTVPSSGSARVCTGALLTSDYVITIAACVYDATAISVTAGTIDTTETSTPPSIKVSIVGTAILHPKFIANNYYNDVALVKLQTPFTLGTNIGTINLAYKYNTDESKDVNGRALRLLGYGDTTANTPATVGLRYQSMNVLSRSKCISKMKLRNVVPAATQDCLDTDSGTLGACNQADMGGLLVYKFDSDSTATLAGLLNYYYACSTPTPNMFIRLGPHWDWIRRYVQVYDNIG